MFMYMIRDIMFWFRFRILPIAYCILYIAYCLLHSACCPLHLAHCLLPLLPLLPVLPLLPILPVAYCLMLIAYCKQSCIYTPIHIYTQNYISIYTHISTGHIWATETTQYNEITFSQVWAQPNYNIWTLAHTHANNQDH